MKGVHMKRIISILMCLVFAFAFFGCGNEVPESIAGVEYYHYEPADFNKDCKELEKLASGDNEQKVLKLYDKLYDECMELDSLYAVSYVIHSIDQNDEYYTEEQQYSYDTLQDCCDRLGGVCRKITEGPCAKAFREHVGDKVFDQFAKYEVMSKKEKKLLSRENKLIDKYYKACDKASFKYKNKIWTQEELFGEEGDELAEKDYSGYVKVYNGLTKDLNDRAGPIFLKLLKLRIQIAEEEGYDNYADYVDKEVYSRDYTSEDLERFHSDVKKVSTAFFEYYYGESLSETPALSTDQVLDALEKYSGEISKLSGRACDKLMDEELYSIGSETCRMEGGYTITISPKNPFIFDYVQGDNCLRDMSHEFGHFTQFCTVDQDNLIVSEQNNDLAEIPSNGFECLLTHYYDKIYGKAGKAATDQIVEDMFFNIIDGCMEDEFQRIIYDNPDMTLDEINKAYASVQAQYMPGANSDGYSWVYIPHTFESPLYYVSYAASGIASLQIWDMSQKDFKEAVKVWENFVTAGPYDRQYLAELDKVGLKKFTDPGVVEETCGTALKFLKK
ncbi:MAG: hypothetical protein Q4D99_00615 [Bacillota bacterium]|nr:hypothetical protein [Bacillota bacterium]